jgi:hypothetical protein
LIIVCTIALLTVGTVATAFASLRSPASAAEPRCLEGVYAGTNGVARRLPSREDADRIGNAVEPEKEAPPVENAAILDGDEFSQLELIWKEVSYRDALGQEKDFRFGVCMKDGKPVLVPSQGGGSSAIHATGKAGMHIVETDLALYTLLVDGTMALVAPVRDGTDVREAMNSMTPTTPEGTTRDVFLGSRPFFDATRMRMVYYSNWRLAFEDSADAANGGYRLHDLETGEDKAIAIDTAWCLGWSRSGSACFVDDDDRLVLLDSGTMATRIVASLPDGPLGLVGDEILSRIGETLTVFDVEIGASRTIEAGGHVMSIVVNDVARDRAIVTIRPERTSSERLLCLYREGATALLRYPLAPGLRTTGISWLDERTVLVATDEYATRMQRTYAIDVDEFVKEVAK